MNTIRKAAFVVMAVMIAGMTVGCIGDFERAINDPYGSGEKAFRDIDNVTGHSTILSPTPLLTPLQVSTPTQKLDPIDILFNDMVANDVADKGHYSMEGGSNDVHICGNMAVEQAEWIRDNYEYETGVVLLLYKYQGDSHAQTWVVIDDERYVLESTADMYWTEDEHNNKFGETNKICFVSISKGKEHAKSSAEYHRSGS